MDTTVDSHVFQDGLIKQSFARRLRGLREAAGLTQGELADKLGVSRGSISYYETGERVPDIVFLGRASNYFGVGISFLLGQSENQNPSNEELGLFINFSDKAIAKLLDLDCGGYLSDFIENEKFESLFELANYFFWDNIYDPGQYVKREGHFEYYAFQVSRVFLSILSDLKQEILEFLAKQPPANFESLDGTRRQALENEKQLREEEKQFILDKISYYRNKGDSILQSAKNDSAELHARYEAEFEAWKNSPEYREGLRKKQAISNYVQKESEGDGVK